MSAEHVRKIKLVGFRGDQDSRIIKRKFISEQPLSTTDDFDLTKLIAYLEEGYRIFGITLWVFDKNVSIGPYMIKTDGHWLWPSHLPYYLNKGDCSGLTKEFIDHVKASRYLSGILSKIKL